jgi:calcineurin-like phosphoesterase family protein
MIYYIADLHIGHENVLRFDARPFADITEMNETLIRNWNERVTDADTVYVLGDAFWKNEAYSIQVMQQLHGHKHLIQGNHDRVKGSLRLQWESIEPYREINDGNTLVVLSHYPIPFYRNQHNRAVMLYGHVHNSREWQLLEQWKRQQWDLGIPCRLINVGCMMDYMDYTPRTLEELLSSNPMPELDSASEANHP